MIASSIKERINECLDVEFFFSVQMETTSLFPPTPDNERIFEALKAPCLSHHVIPIHCFTFVGGDLGVSSMCRAFAYYLICNWK